MVSETWMQTMPEAPRNSMQAYLKELMHTCGQVFVGTMCSGTDLVMVALAFFTLTCGNMIGHPIPISHMFACELSPRGRKFIGQHSKANVMVEDGESMSNESVWDLNSNAWVPTPAAV